jgi:hypothetical protein
MRRMYSALGLAVLLGGCSSGAYNMGTLDRSTADLDYCHRILEPIGPSDPARPAQDNHGDFISYSGPCEGPTRQEMIRGQRRFEQFRFGRDYIDP